MLGPAFGTRSRPPPTASRKAQLRTLLTSLRVPLLPRGRRRRADLSTAKTLQQQSVFASGRAFSRAFQCLGDFT